MNSKMMIAALISIALVGCAPSAISESDAGRPDGETVKLIAVAPDGTHLWRFGNVYFASTGTERRVNCGKNCSRDERVPTAEVTQ